MRATFFSTGCLMLLSAVAQTQDQLLRLPPFPAAMAACGKRCITNVVAQASGPRINCPIADPECLCGSMNFWYGIRDCSQEACGKVVYEQVANWKDNTLCGQGPPVEVSTGATPSAPASTTKTAKEWYAVATAA